LGFSFFHLIFVVVIVALIFGPKPFKRVGTSAGEFWRGLKRGYEGKHDIDITDSVKKLPPDDE
jgi:Sec-independent protein translocase protein TatA